MEAASPGLISSLLYGTNVAFSMMDQTREFSGLGLLCVG